MADRGINAGIAAQPLVTSAQPVVNPDAVTALTDAFHRGFLTADDITQRIGQVAQAKKKATLQELSEYVDPGAIQARQAALQASTAQSGLVTSKADAAMGLVPNEAALSAESTQRSRADLWQKPAIDAYLSWGNTPIKKVDPEGNETNEIDTEATANAGADYMRSERMMMLAQEGLKGQWTEVKDQKTGQPRRVFMNGRGEDVTPRPDNKTFNRYQQMWTDSYEFLHSPPKARASGGRATAPATAAPAVTAAPTPTATAPQPASDATMRAGLVQDSKIPIQAVLRMTPAEVQDEWQRNRPVVQPAAAPVAAAKPVVQPGTYEPMSGLPAGAVPGTTMPEVLDEIRKRPQYSDWSAKLGPMRDFQTAAMRINTPASTEEKSLGVKVMNQKDFALIQSIRQLSVQTASGGSSGRGTPDLQSKQIEETLPRLEKLQEWQQVLAGTGTLSDGTRARLVQLGNDYIHAKEQGVLPSLAWATQTSGMPAETLFGANSDEYRLLQGNSMKFGGAAPTAGAKPVVLPSGVRVSW